MEKLPETQNKNLKSTLFERIEEEKVCPRSRMFFKGRECFIWTLWLISVVAGALAVAISLFVVTHHQYALYEATHENFFTFLVEALPYIWIILFGTMSFVAIYNLRHTKQGYKYSVPFILMSSVVLSFAGGSALQLFGFGYTVDSLLGNQMPMYMSQEKVERKLWQQPDAGRLIGSQVMTTLATTSTVVFEDTNGIRWRMEIHELFPHDQELLSSQKLVRVLGKTLNTEARVFHACSVFPWMMEKQTTLKDMSAERDSFLKRAYEQKKMADNRLALMEQAAFASSSVDNVPSMRVCAEIAAIRRVSMP